MVHKNRIKTEENNLHEKELKSPSYSIGHSMDSKEMQKTLIRIIELANGILQYYIMKKEDENEETRLVRSQSILINLFLPFCIRYMDEEISESDLNKSAVSDKFESILNDNLSDVNRNNCSKIQL